MLSALIQKFDKLGNELLLAVRRGDEDEINRVDAQLQPLTRRIFEFEASDYNEIMAQIAFFNRLAMKNCEDDSSVRRYTAMMSTLFVRYLEPKDGPKPVAAKRELPPLFEGYDPSLQELVLDSLEERVAAFDLDYRYIYCNQRNAEFHNKRPSDFIGKHLLDMIDQKRFLTRAKPRIDQCFGGARISYTYEAADAHGRLFEINCRMTPLTGPDQAIAGAVLILNMQPMFARTA
ncbi:PAS domain-containing protein [Hoeflea sp.]|uniref:PAS domain-containing protein n=1 Tax=Hoeflea sp. TaxID=1940281 RepID=UPI003A935910